jgi:hypothetical protein
MKLFRIVLGCLLLISAQTFASETCVLPVPDGGDVAPASPSIVGKVVSASKSSFSVRPYRSKKVFRVDISNATQFFTVYGGGVSSSDLRIGQHVLIWLKQCAKPSTKSNQSSVVQLCSLAAEPCTK